MVAITRAQFVNRTAGSELGKWHVGLKREAYQDYGPVVQASGVDDGANGATVNANKLYQYKQHVVRKTAAYTMLQEDTAAVVTNTGAKGVIEFTLPNIDATGYGYNSIFKQGFTDLTTTTEFRWIKSAGGTNEYYCELAAGGDPGLADPVALYKSGGIYAKGTVGTLAGAQTWAYGDNDTLGFSTVYVKVSSADLDPDTLTDSIYCTYKYRVTTFNASQSLFWTGLTTSTHTAESDGLLGSDLNLVSMDVTNIFTGTAAGTWTRID